VRFCGLVRIWTLRVDEESLAYELHLQKRHGDSMPIHECIAWLPSALHMVVSSILVVTRCGEKVIFKTMVQRGNRIQVPRQVRVAV
jgi:hypothetical protein